MQNSDDKTRAELAAAIAYALKHKVPGLTWKRGQAHESAAAIAADRIVAHLELSNFTFGRGPPTPVRTSDQSFPGSEGRK